MFCPKCGAENPDGTRFCIRCGDPMTIVNQTVNINKDPVQPNAGQFQNGQYQQNAGQYQNGQYQQNAGQFQNGQYQQMYNQPYNANQSNATLFSILAYIPFLFFFGLLSQPEKNDPFVKNHVNNGIILTILSLADTGIAFLPVIGRFISAAVSLGILIIMVIGIVNVTERKPYTIPGCQNIKFII